MNLILQRLNSEKNSLSVSECGTLLFNIDFLPYISALSADEKYYCLGEKFAGYKSFQNCKQYCLDQGGCVGFVTPRNHETWCYTCTGNTLDYYKNSDHWDVSMCG